jgi:gamma-glutamyl:cysteine ligase YbdK (ATP-grasp superfamily)
LSSDDQVDNASGSGEPFSVGVEEEVFLVDPVSGRQANASTAVQERLGPVRGTIERELQALAADVPDYTWFRWKPRPHPRLGTVEVRALDAQAG